MLVILPMHNYLDAFSVATGTHIARELFANCTAFLYVPFEYLFQENSSQVLTLSVFTTSVLCLQKYGI